MSVSGNIPLVVFPHVRQGEADLGRSHLAVAAAQGPHLKRPLNPFVTGAPLSSSTPRCRFVFVQLLVNSVSSKCHPIGLCAMHRDRPQCAPSSGRFGIFGDFRDFRSNSWPDRDGYKRFLKVPSKSCRTLYNLIEFHLMWVGIKFEKLERVE